MGVKNTTICHAKKLKPIAMVSGREIFTIQKCRILREPFLSFMGFVAIVLATQLPPMEKPFARKIPPCMPREQDLPVGALWSHFEALTRHFNTARGVSFVSEKLQGGLDLQTDCGVIAAQWKR